MNKKLVAAAVAGALAMPAIALAAGSSVTITGDFKVGVENFSMGNAASTRANSSEMRVVDNSSQIHFNVNEDLGGGLAAIGQLDIRPAFNSGLMSAGGNTFVGLKGDSWGQVTLGRWDLHYYNTGDTIAAKAGALEAWNVALMDGAAGGNVAVANMTRTPNVVRYDSPNWNGFALTAAWSANPIPAAATSNDLGTAVAGATNRKGNGYVLTPSYTASNWGVGYSYWDAKADNPGVITAATIALADQRSDKLWGYYTMGGFRVALAWDKSRLNDPTGGGGEGSNRTAWSIPLSYNVGPHTFYLTYTTTKDDSSWDAINPAGPGLNSGAKEVAIAYNYDLSKLTSVGITYARINNNNGAQYNLFTSVPLGSADVAAKPGEDPSILQATIRQGF